MGAIGGLVLDRQVSPGIVMDDCVGGGESSNYKGNHPIK